MMFFELQMIRKGSLFCFLYLCTIACCSDVLTIKGKILVFKLCGLKNVICHFYAGHFYFYTAMAFCKYCTWVEIVNDSLFYIFVCLHAGFVACPQGPAYRGVCPLVSAYGILVRSHVCLPAPVRAGSTIVISVCDNVSFKCL